MVAAPASYLTFCGLALAICPLTARSVPAQSQPYPPLADVVAEQSVFPLQGIRATLVGFRTGTDLPYYVGLLSPGATVDVEIVRAGESQVVLTPRLDAPGDSRGCRGGGGRLVGGH